MANIHLAGGEEDEYAGFGKEDVAPALATHDLEYDPAFQVARSVNCSSTCTGFYSYGKR